MLESCIIIIWLFLQYDLRSKYIVKLVFFIKHTVHAFESRQTILLVEIKPWRISIKLILIFHLLSLRKLARRTWFILLCILTFIWFLAIGVSMRLSKLMLMFVVLMVVAFLFIDAWRVRLYDLAVLLIVVVFFLFVADRVREGEMVIVSNQTANLALLWLVEIFLQLAMLHLSDTQQKVLTYAMHWFLGSALYQTHTYWRVSIWISGFTNNTTQFFAPVKSIRIRICLFMSLSLFWSLLMAHSD